MAPPEQARAADWLLDNDFQISRAIRELAHDMPEDFYRRLNTIRLQGSKPLPRVFAIAHALVDNPAAKLSRGSIVTFINAYQEQAALSTAELWAMPSMLRLAAIEFIAAAFARLDPSLIPPFKISPLMQPGSNENPTDSVARAVTILIAVRSIEWRDVVDQTSVIERMLEGDPAGVYAEMDFVTRDSYRKAVEEVAAWADAGEEAIAQSALELATQHHEDSRKRHVGYWLTDAGREQLERKVGAKVPAARRIRRLVLDHAGTVYALTLGLLVAAALAIPVVHMVKAGASFAELAGGLLLALLPASVLSVAILHWLIAQLLSPRILPMMDFRNGIPEDFPTCVAVPLIIGNVDDVPHVLENIEIRRLSNPDAMLRFVLLTDCPDAPREVMPGDDAIGDALAEGVRILNHRYGGGGPGPFVLMHRRRRYNPAEERWMGWERKRGKLEQLNEFLLSGEMTDFTLCEGDVQGLRGTRFVIALDADTSLPLGAANRLVGAIAHPLNQPRLDPQSQRLESGYSIIQPRIEILPLKGPVSLFCRLYSGDTAIDIYSRAVSDVYQDMFGTGIFVGKGIYDVTAFQACLKDRVPENAILSHDLFEGVYARAALASNIVLYEDFPETYTEHALRLHRWVRGDWQLLPWLGTRVPHRSGTKVPNELSGLDRWKVIDNLRRSLLAPSLLLFFVGGWMVLPGSAWLWTVLAALAPGAYLVGEIHTVAFGESRKIWLSDFMRRFGERTGRWFLTLTFLVSDAVVSLDAIARAIWRMTASHKKLLEWRSAAHVKSMVSGGSARANAWRMMWPSTVFALGVGADLAVYDHQALLPALPLLLLWLVAPEIAYWLGKPRHPRREVLDRSDHQFLKHVVRRTWLYFETFVGPEDNWLPPDNYQDEPRSAIAHRTSPTNIGLFLAAVQAARDFGFIDTSDLVARIRNALDSIDKLESYHGHIFNWYDTRTLAPLEPRYVSTVDSGNLAIALIALREGMRELEAAPAIKPADWTGLLTTLELLFAAIRKLPGGDVSVLDHCEERAAAVLGNAAHAPSSWRTALDDMSQSILPGIEAFLTQKMAHEQDISSHQLAEAHAWIGRSRHHVHAMARELDSLLPWLRVIEEAPEGSEDTIATVMRMIPPSLPLSEAGRAEELIGEALGEPADGATGDDWRQRLRLSLRKGLAAQCTLRAEIEAVARRADALAYGMDFKVLYDPGVRLFRIGYNVSTGQIDSNHYDLLASEARLASIFAIAKHDVPVEHWFALGRPVTRLEGRPAILSWSGSMFEYLMPPLFLPGLRDTLLGESESMAVRYQRDYARQRDVPWGISESAFATTDADGNYQYRAFGAPGLALRRGLTDDLVVAPYASALALCCWPAAAVKNMKTLEQMGALGLYGYHDAVDFTPSRVPEGRRFAIVHNYMAHHLGMTVIAIANAMLGDIFVHRVLSGKRLQSVDLLFQERVPWEVPIESGRIDEAWHASQQEHVVPALFPWVPTHATVPQMQFLGNGRMSSWISESGAGGLFWNGTALTRWLPDSTCDASGYWLYVSDLESGDFWSAGRQPTGVASKESKVVFHQHMVEFFRRDHGIAVRMEVTVPPAEDADIREITVTNDSDTRRSLAFTTYAEVVLAPPLDDERHPAFSKLFVGSEYVEDHAALLFHRRPRRPEQKVPVLLHKLVSDDPEIRLSAFETDRARFLGRLGSIRDPAALRQGLTGRTGWTLDCIMSLQVEVTLEPGEMKRFALVTAAAPSRQEVVAIGDRYASVSLEGVRRDAGRAAAREVDRLGIDPARLPELQVLASLLAMPHPALRQVSDGTRATPASQPDLWRFGISGDVPMLVLRLAGDMPSHLLELLVKAQQLWRQGGLRMDLVILSFEAAGYEAPLRERILAILRDADVFTHMGGTGGIHLIAAANSPPECVARVCAAAHAVIEDSDVPLSARLERILPKHAPAARFAPSGGPSFEEIAPLSKPSGLAFDNGIGGFEPQSDDYIIHLEPGEATPAPWCNVIANEDFGTVVSDSGLGFTWSVNSGENRLTPWSNDPICETPGEVVYLRDEQTGGIWTPTPAPLGRDAACQIRHGAGWTTWSQNSHGLEQVLRVFVPEDAPVKLITLRLVNQAKTPRRLTATCYVEWLLGAMASRSKPHVICEYDATSQTILARNGWNPEFGARVAFLTASLPPHSLTGNRYDFLGSEGDTARPVALHSWNLGERFAPSGDACGAYQVHFDLEPGGASEVTFVLGQGESRDDALALAARWSDSDQVAHGFTETSEDWRKRLGSVKVKTPDQAFDLMANRWLIYQTVACRLMARAGFYQAGGAFGFRDQLQDVLAILPIEPARARTQILRAAARQFQEGDVQHWWHPPSGRGVRTRISDDFIWLAYVTARYVSTTGDDGILKEEIQFLSAPPLKPEEHDRYALFEAHGKASLLDHCDRALSHMMATGAHGLPLMGTGDWNDGMDRIGDKGQGESVWLAWFQIATITLFAPLLERHGRSDRAGELRHHADDLAEAITHRAWDGEWFVRAFDDEGIPWGSASNDECQIDAIAQSWAAMATPEPDTRIRTAMVSAQCRLIDPANRLVKLLDPPFSKTPRDPGYIKAYPPGVRENGGQYTHAATWMGHALAALGDGDKAWQVFDFINPIRRVTDAKAAAHYLREPYVLAGDVSGAEPGAGQGGWSWYTGAAGWTWQLAVEAILGIRMSAGAITVKPCMPREWGCANVTISGPSGTIHITIEDPDHAGSGVRDVRVDGDPCDVRERIEFPGAGETRNVIVTLGAAA